ncbi:hypothetical protein ACIBBB_34875 [Streptomyces sp. NPDC051217]|uniref:hypothetical protein n=1 Tax=Streptomyces sp. NPDC051217 TaxID=3365644 RepID=UPI0037B00B45
MTQRTANHQLKNLIDEFGLPYDGVARAVKAVAAESGRRLGTNKSAVHHWTRGAVPEGETSAYLAEALSRRLGRRITREDLGLGSRLGSEDESIGLTLDFDPIETLTAIGSADVNRRRFLAASAFSMAAATLPLESVQETAARTRTISGGALAGHADVAAVRDMVKLFMDMDERHGGQHGRAAFVQYLITDVRDLCRARFSSEEVRAEALSVASAAAHLCGWKAYDSGEQGLAQRYYMQSLLLARESGIAGQDGFVMRTMSQQGMKLHRPEHCLALAKTGRRQAALAGVDRAHTALAAGRGPGTRRRSGHWRGGHPQPPPTPAQRRCSRRSATTATPHRATRPLPRAGQATYARIIALDLVAQAEQQAKQGGIEQACATWDRAIETMAGVKSSRTIKAIRSLRGGLRPYRARGVRVAAELDEHARVFLAQHS